jgi:lysophospholipase L1-like esterase
MASILCFGDSNTWGTSPSGNRYNEAERWTTLLANQLADKHTLLEAGQPNRTLVHNSPFSTNEPDNPLKEKSGIRYINSYLIKYQPDVVLIMLGTNDLKKRYELTSTEIGQGMYKLVTQIIHFDYGSKNVAPKILIIAPPPIYEVGAYVKIYAGAAEKSMQLAKHYLSLAQVLGCAFFDAGSIIKSCPIEGIHWQVNQHSLLSDALVVEVNNILT